MGWLHAIHEVGARSLSTIPTSLALSNPKKSLGRVCSPPCAPPCAAARRGLGYAQPNKRRGQIVLIAPQQVKTKPCASPTPVLIIKL